MLRNNWEYSEFNNRYSPPLNMEERVEKRRREKEESIASSSSTAHLQKE